jgi:hypothetical protein
MFILIEPAKLATESFARSRGLGILFHPVSPGSLRSPGAITLSRFALDRILRSRRSEW